MTKKVKMENAKPAKDLVKKPFKEGDLCVTTMPINGVYEGAAVEIIEVEANGAMFRCRFCDGPKKGQDLIIKAAYLDGVVSPPAIPGEPRDRSKSKFAKPAK